METRDITPALAVALAAKSGAPIYIRREIYDETLCRVVSRALHLSRYSSCIHISHSMHRHSHFVPKANTCLVKIARLLKLQISIMGDMS